MKNISGLNIKHVVIKRFKSYREMLYMDQLSKGVNLIIGSNGNGKSNFLDSIMYVVTDKYQNMRQEDKKLLLHEDITDNDPDSKKFSIELVLDNSSHRFPVEKDQVSITKIYDTEDFKEEIIINQKKLLKSDVQNILEGAGFMKSNPYYIIQQGKINQILNCTDEEYYDIFSEAMGTKIYEEKKMESLKLLEENEITKSKIQEQEKEIQTHIDKLSEQCEDYENYSKIEKKRRGVEYFILNEQINELELNIGFLQERKEANTEQIKEVYQKQNLTKNEINQKLKEIEKLNEVINNSYKKIQKIQENICELESQKKNHELKNKQRSKSEIQKELNDYIKNYNSLLQEKKTTLNKFNDTKNGIEALEKDIANIKKEFNELKGKTNYLLISNPKERKAYISSEIKKLTQNKSTVTDSILNMDQNIKEAQKELNILEKNLDKYNSEFSEKSKNIEEINENLLDLREKQRNFTNSIKKDTIDINEFEEQMSNYKKQIENLSMTFPNFEVFKTVMKLKEMKIPGFYGIVLDLIDTNPIICNAVDLILKDRLYTIIVDTMETAKSILEENKKLNGPVINLISLDFVDESSDLNDDEDDDVEWVPSQISVNRFSQVKKDNQLTGARAFLDLIKLNKKFIHKNPEVNTSKLQSILKNFFSKCQIVKDYETGMKYAKMYHYTCVTSANEVIYGGGYLTHMGHFDYNKQRLNLYLKLSEMNNKYYDCDSQKSELQKHKETLMNEQISLQQETDKQFKLRSDYNSTKDTVSKEILNAKQSKTNLEQKISHYQEEYNKLLSQQKEYDSQIKLYNDILNGKEINKQKNTANSQAIENLDLLGKQIIEREQKKNELREKFILYQEQLNNEIPNKENELQNKINELQNLFINSDYSSNLNSQSNSQIFANYDNEIDLYKQNLRKNLQEISDNEKTIKDNQSKITQLNDFNTKLTTQINKLETDINEIKLALKDKNNKKLTSQSKLELLSGFDYETVKKLTERKEKYLKNCNESGINVNEPKIQEKMLEKVYEDLTNINKELKKYDKINRFAKDNLQEFINKKNEIQDKMSDLDEKVKTIHSFIETIDQKNTQNILETFEKVKQSFSKFFTQITGNGKGTMELSQDKKSIHISVSYNDMQQSQSMYQLSGGQKTAAGVALIFALSTIEPPPFYILDEIDAALDPNYRINLAKLIKNLSKNSQFIISTFKPELIDVADNIYMVKFANKTSNIIRVEKEEAEKFVSAF